jgi:ApaG protein
VSLRQFFYRETAGIRITVRPAYLREQSRPAERQFVFVYHVRLENVGTRSAQLISRRWLIHDAIGEDTDVEGDGVVGEQPVIAPGRIHEYRSFCVLKSPNGYMEGQYRFVRPDGGNFEAQIPRFALAAEAATEDRPDEA